MNMISLSKEFFFIPGAILLKQQRAKARERPELLGQESLKWDHVLPHSYNAMKQAISYGVIRCPASAETSSGTPMVNQLNPAWECQAQLSFPK
ncbi:hypothetical protein SCA6_006662 [Theobroma cacao]